MQVSKIIIALAVAAGFASSSFAQGTTAPAPTAAPTAKVAAPAPAAAEKKVEAPKAVEPAKADAAKAAEPAKEAAKPVKHHHKAKKAEVNTEVAPAPVTK